MSTSNLLTQWSRLLLASLQQAGIRHVVISPGSRSTPLVCAALNQPNLLCHSVIDERCAAFYAVAHAKVSGRPVALISTSGSAPAHYFPAVVEAFESGTPLLVLSADRPFELQQARAAQTIDQAQMYGGFCRAFFDVGMPDPTALTGLQRMAAQAVHLTRSPRPGPVHLNVRARKPLEPSAAESSLDHALCAQVDRLIERGVTRSQVPCSSPATAAVETAVAWLASSERCLVVCGPVPSSRRSLPVERFARAAGAALACEASSQLRFAADGETESVRLDALNIALRAGQLDGSLRPDLLVEVSGPPVSNDYERYLARNPDIPRVLLSEHDWPDPQGTARLLLQGDMTETLTRLTTGSAASSRSNDWLDSIRSLNRQAWEIVDRTLTPNENKERPSELAVVRRALGLLPEKGLLCLGNSLPIRHVDVACESDARQLRVWHQRGANGIDGLVSGAIGATFAAASPALLLIGDVSFVHDISGLALAKQLGWPLAILVLENGGGRIFERLPVSDALPPEQLSYWTTPHGLRLEHAGALYGVPATRSESLGDLETALLRAWAHAGASLIVAHVGGESQVELDKVTAELRKARAA